MLLRDRTTVSRRIALRGLASAATALAVGGCAEMAASGPHFGSAALVNNPTLLVATTRKLVSGGRAKPWFGTERSRTITLARATMIPPDEGLLSLSTVGLSDWSIASIQRVGQIDALLGDAAGGHHLLIYVHGFNNTFEAAALDAARLSNGIKFAGDTMVFSWPSRASLLDYNYDRESAMWSRDALDQVLGDVLANPGVGRVNIVAHSVGTMLTMEALRQLYAKLGDYAADRIGAVVFASPDIDMDIFTASVQRIGPLAPKVTIITATDDRALAVSRWVNGSTTRVGAAQKTQLEKLGLRVVDASAQGWGIINHDLFLSNAGVRQAIRDSIERYPRFGAVAPAGIEGGGNLAPPEGAQVAPRMDSK